MKYFWPALNSACIFMLFIYIFITKDINTKAYNECKELEIQLNEQRELTSKVLEEISKRDTVVVYINNINNKK